MAWQSNLINNLLVIFILVAIAMIAYCKIKNVTMVEVFKQLKEIISPKGD